MKPSLPAPRSSRRNEVSLKMRITSPGLPMAAVQRERAQPLSGVIAREYGDDEAKPDKKASRPKASLTHLLR